MQWVNWPCLHVLYSLSELIILLFLCLIIISSVATSCNDEIIFQSIFFLSKIIGHTMDSISRQHSFPSPKITYNSSSLCQQAPSIICLKLVAVSESSVVNKSDTTFPPTTLLLIFEGEIWPSSTHPPIMKVDIHMIGPRTQKHKENDQMHKKKICLGFVIR